MRILQISHGVYPQGNAGVEVYTDALSHALSELGHDVHVATPTDESARFVDNYRLSPLPKSTMFPYGADPPRRHIKNVQRALSKIISEINPHVIHVQNLVRIGWPILRWLEATNRPFSVSLPDYWFLCPGIQRLCDGSLRKCTTDCMSTPISRPDLLGRTFLKLRYRRKRIVHLLNSITAPLFPLSHRTAEIFAASGVAPTRMHVTPWSVRQFIVNEATSHDESSAPLVFAYIGRLSPEKGIDLLLRAFSLIDRNAQLRIYGDGNIQHIRNYDAYQKAPNIRFMGRYDNSEIGKILGSVDAVVVPSNWEEPYGLVVQEALCAEKPIVASNVAGLSEQIVHGLNGYLFARNDASSLTYWLRYIVDNLVRIKEQLSYEFNRRDIREDAERFQDAFTMMNADWVGFKSRSRTAFELGLQRQIQVIAETTGTSLGDVEAKMHSEVLFAGSVVASEWKRTKPSTDAEIVEFYQTTESYLYDLSAVHETSERKFWRREAISIMHRESVKDVLDYGGGCGIDSVAFASAGISCSLFDVSMKNKRFAKRWAELHGVSIDILENISHDKLYDAIYSTELLEHVPNPIDEIRAMVMCLKPGGILLVTHSFDLIGPKYPQHLEKHQVLSARFIESVEEIGCNFEKKIRVPGNFFYLFRRVSVANNRDAIESSCETSTRR